MDMNTKLRNFHQAKWDEPIIYELSVPGQRAILVPETDKEIENTVGDGISAIPLSMQRKQMPNLPELGQPQVLRHFNHLSQENLGVDSNIDIGQGTCTMKYNPKINDQFVRSPEIADMHPYQDESTAQGVLEIMYKTTEMFKEISGLDCFSLQPGGGTHGALTMATVVQAYHESRGEAQQRDEIITTFFSHPCDAAVPKLKGYNVTIIHADENGIPDIEAFKAALSDRTAALFITNPEDIGIYNSKIREFTELAHEAGALCCYDQANANGLLGIARAREAGFDLSFFNLHKTFSSPHGCGGPGSGLVAAKKELRDFLPVPLVEYDRENDRYFLDYDLPLTSGKVKDFYGVVPAIVRTYCWIMSLGAEGLEEVSRVAVLNNNYCMKKILALRGASMCYPEHTSRIEQVRYSWEQMKEETGFGSADVSRRIPDFGTHYWGSHEPFVVPEPFTIEPCESSSKDDIDEYLAILGKIVDECYNEPDVIRHAPHNSTVHHIDHDYFDDPDKWAITWRSYNKKYKGYFEKK